ncbi:MAG TPA: PSD1 and planctomycete cytochrome C domain-containing protein [Verrucomicrobiales bacterium]|nr:PSD1 and planctomycete cytochrome C domain-containing protein [Verrucomicrobiales bacterium]
MARLSTSMRRAALLYVACFVSPVVFAEPVDFAHDVLPILKAHCAKCHTDGEYKGSFSLDTREALLASEAVTAGNSGDSLLVQLLTEEDPADRMPQKADPLSEEDIAILRAWIDEGLVWEEGFTFRQATWSAPLKPRMPSLPPASGAATHPVDRIVLAYFRERSVEPPPPLDDVAFVRRAYLDLIGLLPEPGEVDAYISDRNSKKREKLVAELLARDADYAAHWMSFWNDLLRNDYAGTGYIDGGRKQISSWLYDALLTNQPYNRFVRDLIDPSEESEGFIRGIQWRGNVNASQVQEVQFAQNITQVFLGENMKCASCHDSFINDWKLADAYGLAAIIAEQPLEMHRCDKPAGEMARARFLFPELGDIDPAAPKEERLKQAAALMTSPDNGRLTRTIVNRLWRNLMGRGLVEPVDIMANRPWSEDLLDFLAADLANNGYDLKKTLALMATSRPYASRCVAPEDDPAEDFVFRGPVAKRMTAEQFVDAVWNITGTGPEKIDAPVRAGSDRVRASLVNSTLLMRALGRPNREQVVTTRPAELSTLQALELNNGEEFVALLHRGAEKLLEEKDPAELVSDLYVKALSREPGPEERAATREILGDEPGLDRVADLLWLLFALPEFQIIR